MEKLQFAYAYMLSAVTAPKKDEKGATAVEYGLLVALVAAVIVAAVGFLGEDINDAFESIVTAIPGGNA